MCEWCGTAIRVRGTGTFKCPRCHSAFHSERVGKAVFQPRTKPFPISVGVNADTPGAKALASFVREMACEMGVAAEDAEAIGEAVLEVAQKIADICYDGNALRNYLVQINASESEIVIRTSDYGKRLAAGEDQIKKLFPKAAAAMDQLSWRAHPACGNILTLGKKLA
jgi:hypothetical protein